MSHSQSNFNSGSGSGSIASLKNDSEIFFSSSDTDTSSSMEKLETSSISVQKPTRPLTGYHLFFQLEREYIIQTSKSSDDDKKEDTRPIGKQLDETMPVRYRHIHLSPTWYASGSGKRVKSKASKEKRKHRKTHGVITFLELSRLIASRWADLEDTDKATKLYVAKIAARELAIYRQDMKMYKSCQENLASLSAQNADASKPKCYDVPSFPLTLPTLTGAAGNSCVVTTSFVPNTTNRLELNPNWTANNVESTNATSATLPENDTNFRSFDAFLEMYGNIGRSSTAGVNTRSNSAPPINPVHNTSGNGLSRHSFSSAALPSSSLNTNATPITRHTQIDNEVDAFLSRFEQDEGM
jgi:hypothetical protein